MLPDYVLQLLDSPQISSLACGSGLGAIQLQGAPNTCTFSSVTFQYSVPHWRKQARDEWAVERYTSSGLTAPGVCVQIWDLMCSSTFVQGVVITVVTVHTHVCVSFYTEKTSILMDHDSARYAVEGALTPLGSRMCVSQQGLATVLYSSTHASVAAFYSQWSLKDTQTQTMAYIATFRATSTRYVKCNGWWCNFSCGQLH